MPTPALRALLTRAANVDAPARRANDPVRFLHRYAEPTDQEIAGVFASGLAYGRVSLFLPVLDTLFDLFDQAGGPRAYVDGFAPARDASALAPITYRWNRGIDLAILVAALQRTIGQGRLADAFPAGGDQRQRLTAMISALRSAATDRATEFGLAPKWEALPRGLRMLLPSPADGSACKRWNLYLRWMIRGPDGVDVRAWDHVSPADLVIPLDVHVGRISRMIGLCTSPDSSWRTAEAITAALRTLDAEDPLRFDFALAHLGISDGCSGAFQPTVCGACPLFPGCQVSQRSDARPGIDQADS